MDSESGDYLPFLILCAFIGAVVAVLTFLFAVACTVAAVKRKFIVRPVALYWIFFAGLVALYISDESSASLALSLIISPVFIAAFWYYDRKQTREEHAQFLQSHDKSGTTPAKEN